MEHKSKTKRSIGPAGASIVSDDGTKIKLTGQQKKLIETALKRVINRVPEFEIEPGFRELFKLPVAAGIALLEQRIDAVCNAYKFKGIKVYSTKTTPQRMAAFDESWKDVLREKEAYGFINKADYYIN